MADIDAYKDKFSDSGRRVLETALEESKRMNLSMPGLALAHQLYIALKAQGHGRDGTHALQLALAQLSNVDWKKR